MSTSIERVAAALALALVLAPAYAHATPPNATDLATARELYKSGITALEANDASGAASKLTAAWQLAPTPLIGVALARAQIKLGHYVEARESVLAVRRLEVVANETSHSKQARADAETIDADMAAKIAKLHVEVNGAPSDALVLVDGATTPLASFAVDRPMNPGTHDVELAWGPSPHVHATVTLGEGERKVVTLEAPAAAPPPVTVTTEPVHPIVVTVPHTATVRHLSPLVPIGGAGAGVSIAVGAIFGAIALSASNTVHGQCDKTTHACPPDAQGALHDAQGFGWASTIAFGVAGAATIVFIVGLAMGGRDTTATRALADGFRVRF